MTINKVDNNEKEFMQLGLDAFFSVEDDKNIQDEKNLTDLNESFYMMKAQEQNGSVSMLNEPEEDTWNDL